MMPRILFGSTLFLILALFPFEPITQAENHSLPPFGRDTVLVWKIKNLNYQTDFVVRIAEFSPNIYMEWEDTYSQGTVFMPQEDVLSAKGFISSSLFKSGSDTRAKNATTLWLSRQSYRELKERKKLKCPLDGVTGLLTYKENDALSIEVNRSQAVLPAIIVLDDRGSERWFLDQEDNALMLSHKIRQYDQTLTSVTTNRTNTLRWIKGRKLATPPLR